MQMRTINEAMEHIKTVDAETAFTKNALRKLIVTGEIPSVRIGNKYLVALENVDAFLKNGQVWLAPKQTTGAIRPVEVYK